MNIGFVTTWSRRGTKYQTKFFCDHILNKHRVFYYIYRDVHFENKENQFMHYSFNRTGKPEKVLNWAKSNNLDMVFFIERQTDHYLLDQYHAAGIKTATTIMQENIYPSVSAILKKYSYVICPVKCTYNVLKENNLDNLVFLKWAVDTKLFSPVPKDHFETPLTRFIFNAGWGGAHWRKNPLAVVQAFDKASKDNELIELVFKTQKPLKEYEPEVRNIIDNNPRINVNQENLTLDKLIELYKQCHVSLLPSKWEGIGLPYLESLAQGLPVITVDEPPMNEWIVDGENGYCCKIDHIDPRYEDLPDGSQEIMYTGAVYIDIDDFAEKILLLSDKTRQKKMSTKAIESVAANEETFYLELNRFLNNH
ncbi:MAG: glycosyltransferase family 4 protein [Candidatus Margulisiibacteriota bacterium]